MVGDRWVIRTPPGDRWGARVEPRLLLSLRVALFAALPFVFAIYIAALLMITGLLEALRSGRRSSVGP